MLDKAALRALPSVDQMLATEALAPALDRHGRPAVARVIRAVLDEARVAIRDGRPGPSQQHLCTATEQRLADDSRSSLRPVLNLTGTVLHTNLGRALLAEVAIQAATAAMRDAANLEFDLETGKRGERDDHLRELLTELTGAEDATVVNNNAAAVLIALNTFGQGREAIVSRGELIEIGGAFRMPDIMARAGARLVEVGTTNRTHARDYRAALRPETGLILKVHTSNYRIEGFTAEVGARDLAGMAREAGVPLLNDLGSGTLVELGAYGLAREPTVRDAVAEGADLITFSGDKLLGGPQAGFIVGRKDMIAAVNRNPMKRAMRLDKIRIAALGATLALYRDPARLAERLPTLRHLARKQADIRAQAERLQAKVAERIGPEIAVEPCACESQIGSGALPQNTSPSAGLRLRPTGGRSVDALAAALRRCPVPVVGRIHDGAVLLDLRCLDADQALLDALRDGLA